MAQTWTWRQTGEALHVSLAAGTLTLSFGGHTNLSFDGEGRLVGAWYDGRTYRRALDNRVLMKWSETSPVAQRQRVFLAPDEARQIVDRAYTDARRAYDGFTREKLTEPDKHTPASNVLLGWLDAVSGWNYDALEQDSSRFRQVYKPVSILPPDQYLSVVLQATEGCSYNECSFCTFYRDRAFRIKRPQEFELHTDQVLDFFGRGLFIRRSIFLADANAIVIPQSKLLPLLEVVNQKFNIAPRSKLDAPAFTLSPEQWSPAGIHAFVSAPDALRKSAAELRELSEMNVQRLYVGLESGHDPLRNFLRKPGKAKDVLDAVETIKAGGLQVALIFMAGVGGKEYRDNHFRDTVELIQRMPLGKGDLVYVSPFVPAAGSPYLDDMQLAGYSSLDESEIGIEEKRFRSALLPGLQRQGVRMSRYDIREFVY